MTVIKLSAAMETALLEAEIGFSPNFGVYTGVVPQGTKAQTVKGLASRGLTDDSGIITPAGAEAAQALGKVLPPWRAPGTALSAAQIDQEISEGIVTAHPDRVAEPLADWERELLDENTTNSVDVIAPAVITEQHVAQAAHNIAPDLFPAPQKAVDLDKPHVVPNREDKRKVKFSLRGALARAAERRRVRQVNKYGSARTAKVA